MATINGSTNTSVWTFKLVTTEGTPNVANNTSPLTVAVYLGRSSSAGASYMWGASLSCPIDVTGCARQTLSYSNSGQVDVAAGGWLHLGSKTFTVPHDSDGRKTVTVSASFTNNVSPASGSAKGNVTLTTIARATTPTLSATSVTMGSSVTITLSPADKTFKHKLRYDFGKLTGQTGGLSAGTSDYTPAGNTTVTFTPTISMGSQIPTANSGTCKILCYTYTSGGSHIGTKELNLTLNVPSYSPVISSVALTGNNLRDGVYVQGKSTVTVTTTASSSYGAEIASYSCTVDGVKYTTKSFTTAALKSAAEYKITVTVTDGRGKSVSKEATAFTVYEYKVPYITSFTAVRQTNPTTVVATLVGGVSSLNGKNGKAFNVTLNGKTLSVSASGFTVNGSVTFTGIDSDSTFVATASVADYYTSATMPVVVPTEAVTMDFHYSGTGIAMGKVAEREKTFETAWPIRSSGTFNQNSWASSSKGALTQVIDATGAQHAAVVGATADGERIYSIEFVDSPSTPHMRLYAGSDYLLLGKGGVLQYNNYSIPYLTPLWSGTLSTNGSTATLNQTIANFKYLEIYFHDNDGYYDSKRVRIANGTAISVNVGHTAIGSSGYLKQMAVRLSATTITVNSNKQIAISTTTGTGAANNGVITDGQFIIIDAIVGIK